MRVLVCGGRDWAPSQDGRGNEIAIQLDHLWVKHRASLHVMQGGASGADAQAREWARLMSVDCRTFRADWEAHGKAAGPIRNQRMLDEGKPNLVLAFAGGAGTADMVRRARAAGVEVREIV